MAPGVRPKKSGFRIPGSMGCGSATLIVRSAASITSLMRYKKKYFELESEMEVLLNENAVLKFENLQLEKILDSTQLQLTTQLTTNANLTENNIKLSQSVNVAKKLSIERLEGFGVIQKRSGRLVPTT